jgi:RAD54-like protein 2
MTGRNRVLVICPVNVLQNWNCEFQKWLPKINPEIYSPLRDWDLFILGDNVKTYEARAQLLNDWHNSGGVLLIGYEMFRLLIQRDDSTLSTKATSTNTNGRRKKKLSKKQQNAKRTLFDLEEGLSKIDEEQKQQFLQKEEVRKVIKEALVSPGPDLVICDEGHRIKSLNTEVANALTAIPTRLNMKIMQQKLTF